MITPATAKSALAKDPNEPRFIANESCGSYALSPERAKD